MDCGCLGCFNGGSPVVTNVPLWWEILIMEETLKVWRGRGAGREYVRNLCTFLSKNKQKYFMRQQIMLHICFPGGIVLKYLPPNEGDARDKGSVPRSGRSPGVGNGNPLRYSCLENSTDRGAQRVTVHRFTKSQTQLNLCLLHLLHWEADTLTLCHLGSICEALFAVS